MSVAQAEPVRGRWLAEVAATLVLAWPMIVTNLAQAALTAVDVLMTGWIGAKTLAAGALGANLYFALYVFGMGVVIATTPMVARELGRRRNSVRDIRRTVRQGFWSAVIAVIPIWLLLGHAEAVFLLLGQQQDLARMAGDYVFALMWGILPMFGFMVLRSFMAALERPYAALVLGVLAVPLNAGLNWVLMFGKLGFPALGLVGAGIASSIAALFLFIGMAVVVTRDRRLRRYHVFGRFWRPDWSRLAAFWKLGLPIGVMLALEVTVFNAATFLMGLISEESIAAHAIAIQVASLTFMVPLGLSQAVTVRVGHAFGRGDREGALRAGWTAFAMAVAFMGAMAVLILAVPGPLVAAFLDVTDPENAATAALAMSFLVWAALFQVFDGAQAVAAGMLRGLHDTRVPLGIAAFGYWVIGFGVGILLAFGQGWEGVGIWAGLASALLVVATLLVARWTRMTAPRRWSVVPA